ncbi:outer membrane beta-barrel protein, partial [Vibrio sp. FNV 38]|nr:outer membrane beta-barrel protein [Vibrio sp. FNV 38]
MNKWIFFAFLLSFSTCSHAYWHLGINGNMTDVNGAASHGYGLHGGTQLVRYLDLELGYKNLGEDHRSGVKQTYHSLSVLFQPNYQFNRFNLYANLGFHFFDGEDDINSDFVYGLGANFPIDRMLSVSTEYN